MTCSHQKVQEIVSPCEDASGQTTLAQCFAKGSSALTKCMWTQEANGGYCGPCTVMGVGTIPCLPAAAVGPGGSAVIQCLSQCDDNCPPMFPGCTPTDAPPPIPNGPVSLKDLKLVTSEGAPDYIAVKVMAPYDQHEFTEAARLGAWAAGWGPDTKLPPSAPVAIYGPPPIEGPNLPENMPVLYAPAPPGLVGVPPPGYGYGTAPPPAVVEAAQNQAFIAESESHETKKHSPPAFLRRTGRSRQKVADAPLHLH